MTGFLHNREELGKAERLGRLPQKLAHCLHPERTGGDLESEISQYLDQLAIQLTVYGLRLESLLGDRPGPQTGALAGAVGFQVRTAGSAGQNGGGQRMQLWLQVQPDPLPWQMATTRSPARMDMELRGVFTRLEILPLAAAVTGWH